MFAARVTGKLLAKSHLLEARCYHRSAFSTQYYYNGASPDARIPFFRNDKILSFGNPHVMGKDKITPQTGAKVDLEAALGNLFMGHFPLPHWTSLSHSDRKGNLDVAVPASESTTESIQMMNRNARRPNKANHGARPCSRASRRLKKTKIGKRKR
jgi:hypothetical protein